LRFILQAPKRATDKPNVFKKGGSVVLMRPLNVALEHIVTKNVDVAHENERSSYILTQITSDFIKT
jgi:hypothetical protein